MALIKFIISVIVILFATSCGKSKNELYPLIVGDWKLIEVYGPKSDNTIGWFTIQTSPVQTIRFNPDGAYSIAVDGSITCIGTFVCEGSKSIKLNPENCTPLIESVETIYTLTKDTLTISNKSKCLSSFYLRRDKYIKIK
jgi:hypothetical protein